MPKTDTKPLRAALYIRVSSDEQAIKGLSLEAQQEDLEEYAREKGWIIQGVYIDAAKTARKNIGKREQFLLMLEAVKRGEVDIIVFTRLDRWFRNIADYYKVMEILEAHNCGWLTTQEQYDTTTAGGRLYINLRLSIAQNEADLTAERINAVFDSKIKHGTAVSGKCPFGYRVNEEKRLEIVPEEAAIVQDAFEHYKAAVSQRGTATYIRNKYNVNWCYATCQRLLRERLYTGCYERNGRVNLNFCDPIISTELFNKVQKLLPASAKSSPTGRVYLFTSILVCAECGHKLAGHQSRDYTYYRCNHHAKRDLCPHNREITEGYIETWLFTHLGEATERIRYEWDAQEAERKRNTPTVDRAAINRKLKRLKELYVNEIIDLNEYRKDYEEYKALLEQSAPPVSVPRPNFEAVEEILSDDYRAIYNALSREDKRTLWRSVIKEIHINNDRQITRVVFL